MNKVILISYYFPPFMGVGGMRSEGFYKYLPEFGWEPYIVTAFQNKETNEQYKNIYRFYDVNKEDGLCFRRDSGIDWLKMLKRRLPLILKKQRFDAVYISGGPFLHFSIGSWVKKKYKLPVVLDFRDPFANNPNFPKRKIRDFVARKLEKSWTSNSDAVIVVNKYNVDMIERDSNTPVFVIENGFNDDVIAKVKQRQSVGAPKKFYTIVYAGKFMSARNPLSFIQAISILIRENIGLRFVHIGPQYEPLEQYVKQHDLEGYVDILGTKSYEDTLKLICDSDCGLLISNQHPFESTTKIYDYIGCHKPIFAIGIAEQGGIADVLKRYGPYLTAENTVDDIVVKLRYLVEKSFTIKKPPNVNQFGRRESARSLAQVLNAIKEN